MLAAVHQQPGAALKPASEPDHRAGHGSSTRLECGENVTCDLKAVVGGRDGNGLTGHLRVAKGIVVLVVCETEDVERRPRVGACRLPRAVRSPHRRQPDQPGVFGQVEIFGAHEP